MRTLVVAALVAALFPGCGTPKEDGPNAETNQATNGAPNGSTNQQQGTNGDTGEEVPDGALTYWADIRPVMDVKCITCHSAESGVAPYDWTDPEQTKNLGELIRGAVESGTMPPWYPNTDQCAPLKGELTLTDEEIAKFGQWVDDGKYIGDESNYEAQTPIPADINTERLEFDDMIELTPPEPYEVPTTISDDFRCFTIDPGFETTRHVSGYEIDVDNESLLHHMIVFAVDGSDETAQQLEDLAAEDPEPGFDCFGSPGVDNLSVVGAWAPGGGRVGFPTNTALPLEEGTKFVLQMHYNISEGGMGTDQSGARVWLMDPDNPPAGDGQLVFVGNLPFEVPPGVNGLDVPDEECDVVYSMPGGSAPPERGVSSDEAGSDPALVGQSGCVVQEVYYDIGVPTRIWSAFPHMHLKGQEIEIEVLPWEEEGGVSRPVEEDNECLMDMPLWDFNWQRAYWLEDPVRVPAKGVVRITCRYDNSDEGSPIALGDGSGDEMCLGLLYVSI
jgi:hypothetical protein